MKKTDNNPFKVPENYFEDLGKDLLAKTKKPRRFVSTPQVFRYAAALTLAIGIGSLIYFSLPARDGGSFIAESKSDSMEHNLQYTKLREREDIISLMLEDMSQFNTTYDIDQLELTEEEYEYLEYYLYGDLNQYLTYNEFDL